MTINHLEEFDKRLTKYVQALKKNIQDAKPVKKLNPHQYKLRGHIVKAQTEVLDEVLKGIPKVKEKVEFMR